MSDSSLSGGAARTMRLADLNPKIDKIGAARTLWFDCPLGHPHRLTVPTAAGYWTASGEFPDSYSLTPSIHAHNGIPFDEELREYDYEAASLCGWHGFITNGEIR